MFSLGNPAARRKDKGIKRDAGREQNMDHPEEMLGGKTAEISQEGCDGRRRSFLGLLLGAGAAGVGALLSVPLFRFILHPLLTTTSSSSWKEIGTVEDLASITSPVKKLVKIEQRDDRLGEGLVRKQGCDRPALCVFLSLPAFRMFDRLA